MLTQILAATPIWVFVVFFVLIFYGYLQSKTREASKTRVIMLPMIMILLSVGGVLSSFGGRPAGLLTWAIGFAVAVGMNRILQAPAGVTYNPATRRFHLPGSWTPLCLMMAIYFAKYVVGATTAMRPDIVATTQFAVVLSGLSGLLSGTFFARFLHIWSTSQRFDATPLTDVDTSPKLEQTT